MRSRGWASGVTCPPSPPSSLRRSTVRDGSTRRTISRAALRPLQRRTTSGPMSCHGERERKCARAAGRTMRRSGTHARRCGLPRRRTPSTCTAMLWSTWLTRSPSPAARRKRPIISRTLCVCTSEKETTSRPNARVRASPVRRSRPRKAQALEHREVERSRFQWRNVERGQGGGVLRRELAKPYRAHKWIEARVGRGLVHGHLVLGRVLLEQHFDEHRKPGRLCVRGRNDATHRADLPQNEGRGRIDTAAVDEKVGRVVALTTRLRRVETEVGEEPVL